MKLVYWWKFDFESEKLLRLLQKLMLTLTILVRTLSCALGLYWFSNLVG